MRKARAKAMLCALRIKQKQKQKTKKHERKNLGVLIDEHIHRENFVIKCMHTFTPPVTTPTTDTIDCNTSPAWAPVQSCE